MRRLLALPLIAATGLTACLPPHPPPAPAPSEVIPKTADVALTRLPPATIAAYLGSYRSGGETLTIRRVGDLLYAARSQSAPIPLKFIGLGTFSDGDGTTYLFVPVDGSTGRLRTITADGTSREWKR